MYLMNIEKFLKMSLNMFCLIDHGAHNTMMWIKEQLSTALHHTVSQIDMICSNKFTE